ncbi:Outer membrane efflux protein [Arcticibacter svalbardensis MN12-7]|uniref:Outer membrane efflux protein n=2 Tax=Arcticibacter TaxID=1288026 RepID=R9GPZ7_9SPHI|nr:Outer membrane efflux protein [Arcticibacter svalbardensis MN12-7]
MKDLLAQSTAPFTIEVCYQLAKEHYPLIKKRELILQNSKYLLQNSSKTNLPQLNVSGQASYQSETVSFPTMGAGISFPSLDKDQYKILADVSQNLLDGGNTRNQKAAIRANEAVQQQSLEVNLQAVKERINQVYFSILLLDEQLKQNAIRISDLNSSAAKVSALIKNGTSFRSNMDELKAELVQAEMTNIEIRTQSQANLEMLSILTGSTITSPSELIVPKPLSSPPTINRPELKLYDLQKKIYAIDEQKLQTDYLPKLSAFFQGGYGRPTLNFIKNEFGPWYITGVRLNWAFGSLYTLKDNKKIVNLNRLSIEVERESFLQNTTINLTRQTNEILKFKALIEQDRKVIELRASIKKAAQAQQENGVITMRDYISQLNAENSARQTLILHTIQLLQSQYNYLYTSGN